MMHRTAREALRRRFLLAAALAGKGGDLRINALDEVDTILDEFLGYDLLATEWDADQWGLDPDRWMEAERAEMRSRADGRHPVEAVDA